MTHSIKTPNEERHRHRSFIGHRSYAGVTLSLEGYRIGAIARRIDLLTSLRAELKGPSVIKTVDVSQPELAMARLR